MKPKIWMKSPKGLVAIAMLLFMGLASWASRDPAGPKNALIAVASAVIVEIACSLATRRKRIFPDGAFITGMIVSLVLSATSPWYVVAATSALAVLSKFIVRYKNKPVFNPATVGLVLSVPLFHAQQSWWGAFGDNPAWLLPVLAIAGYWIVGRVQKFPLVFAYLLTYLLAMLVLGIGLPHVDTTMFRESGFFDALRPPFANATLFFALFMLTDLPTSPAKTRDQIFVGMLAALLGAAIYAVYGGLMYLFFGLLAGNAYHFLRQRFAPKRRSARSFRGGLPS